MKALAGASKNSESLFYVCVLGYFAVGFGMACLGPVGKHLYLFGALYVLSFGFLFGVNRFLPDALPARTQWSAILCGAVVMRLAFLFFPAAGDINRYIWEGHVLNQGFNPYLYAPDASVLKPFVDHLPHVWEHINHKEASACYPPLALLLFRLWAWISPTHLCFKIFILGFDLAAVSVLALLLRSRGLPPRRLLLYAWNPLVLVFIVGEGHLDVLQVFFTVLCMYLVTTGKREGWGFFALGCAAMTKYFAVIIAPFLINAHNWKKIVCMIGAALALYIPFRDTGTQLFTSLLPFGTLMHYNDSLSVLLRAVLGGWAVGSSLVILLSCCAVIFLVVHDPMKSSYLAVGCLLLLLPTLHPWYLTLITPFLTFFPNAAWLYLHAAVAFTFPVIHAEYYGGVFQEIPWLKLLEYLPFYAFLLRGFRRNPGIGAFHGFRAVHGISVVIPTLNESANIVDCLTATGREGQVGEVLVVDGGSRDSTRELARSMGARVIAAPKGRGNQIATGVAHCREDVVVILHADCRVRDGVLRSILQQLNDDPECIGGALGMQYLKASANNRAVALLNNARARWAGISFGDQAQFFRSEALPLIGGFPRLMLMEDVEFSLRLKEHGRMCFIPQGVMVSSRQWERVGFFANFRRVLGLCLSYLVRRRLGMGDADTDRFYERYYAPESVRPRNR